MLPAKFIYNPKAGAKRSMLASHTQGTMLEVVFNLFRKYDIPFKATPTAAPGDARQLAIQAASEGYETVIVAGGDGTVGETANGLIGSDLALGIIPVGTFMNVARMLSIPFDLEEAVKVIRMRNIRRIDVGELVSANGKDATDPSFFLEAVGIGFEAELQSEFLSWERGEKDAWLSFLKRLRHPYRAPLKMELDDGRLFESADQMILISNGPYADAALPISPSAKLNDRVLTIRRYKMSRTELMRYFLFLKFFGKMRERKVEVYKSTTVRITSDTPHPVHADGRVFASTPISIKIRPEALRVIAGFPDSPEESSLIEKQTYLAP